MKTTESIFDTEKIARYMERIFVSSPPEVSLAYLKKIHKAHMLHIPFENLSIHNKEIISLDREALYNKIILRKRGGFCYELNTLFYSLLVSMGYNTIMVSARVFDDGVTAGPEFDHMALITALNGRKYLCDVGFGESFLEPLEMIKDKEQSERKKTYKISAYDSGYLLLAYKENKRWDNAYLFSEIPRSVDEFNYMCSYHQDSPDSHFTQKVLCTLATPSGRITLRDNRIIITGGKKKKEIYFEGKALFAEYLFRYFGIDLSR